MTACHARSLFIWVMYCVAKPSEKAAADDAEAEGREGRWDEGVSGCKEGKERERAGEVEEGS